ncbi:filamentous haemagglutinin family protein [Pandoraea nosoerga]|uniref:Hemagglutinin n=1 Tax=Pandoraea nosoerga TaxID=2508296 RepID=A0A5E4VYG2_9BURK|nr:filamentous hemagglutinin family protein [Pandoraea nosoerga]VVE17458.1 hemagglutinin [Pandoraea nosoerga]
MRAVAVFLASSGLWSSAHAQQAFSSAWFAARGAAQTTASQTGRLPNGMPVTALMDPSAQQQQANAQLQRSIANLGSAAQGIAAMQAAQASARAAAANSDATIPDGLAEGGLKVDTNSLTKGWINAQAPTQSTSNGKTNVNIQQTADKAILNWETFNVGRNTSVNFAQQSDWAVLNRVNDPQARPSQIQGQIHGDGTVLVLNRNGVIFGGASQVDTRNLVVAAANMSDAQFKTGGLYGANGTTPSFTDALGKVEVQAGASITTRTPTSVTQGGGYVLLLGKDVSNAGTIVTPQGQVALAAGDSFVIRKGVGTDANTSSTTRGNEISPQLVADSTAGKVVNTGLLMAPEGDITLAGRDVQQLGVAVSTTTVNTRGTIHLLNSASDTQGKVTLGNGALTSVLISDNGATALDSQRSAIIKDSAAQDFIRRQSPVDLFDNLSRLDDRRDQSRVEIVSGGNVEFQGNSLTLATGGQLAVSATGRSFVATGAQLDASGAVGVSLSMDSNNVKINVQGNEQRDSPANRDRAALNNANIWIDRRRLLHTAAGAGGYDKDRYYTPGGLLEVGGYLDNIGHRIGEWAAQGGTVAFSGGNAVTQAGSTINVSGGSLDVQTGYLNQTWLRGADGQIYNANAAPANVAYSGVYTGFDALHPRWGTSATESYASPLIAPQRVLQNGYTVGRDAGRLIISTPTASLAGDVVAATYQGPSQVKAADATLADGYLQAQQAAARGAELILGSYQSAANWTPSLGATGVFYNLSPVASTIVFTGDAPAAEAAARDAGTTLALDSRYVSLFGVGAIRAAASDSLRVEGALSVTPGGTIALYAPHVSVAAGLTAHGGTIALGNVVSHVGESGVSTEIVLPPAADPGGAAGTAAVSAAVSVADGVRLDTTGLWSNLALDGNGTAGLPFVNGGDVSVVSTGDVGIGAGARIDVSSGAVMRANGSVDGGSGGDVTLEAGHSVGSVPTQGRLSWLSDVRGYGVNGGGTLSLSTGGALAIGPAPQADAATPSQVRVDPAIFQRGFSNYRVNGHDGLVVAENTALEVIMPVLRADPELAGRAATGSDPMRVLSVWTPPQYTENPLGATLARRAGASAALSAGYDGSNGLAPLTIGRGATITVDPGQSIRLSSEGQLTIDGTLNAWGGSIALAATGQSAGIGYANDPTRAIWIGDDARLDAAARAYVAHDTLGRAYGIAPDGGSITVNPSDAYVVVRPGAVLDVSGAAARVDRTAGTAASGAPDGVTLAGDGGSITLHSNNGFALEGTLRAAAGAAGAGATGGTLGIYFDTRTYTDSANLPTQFANVHDITLVQNAPAPDASVSPLQYGKAVIGVDKLRAGAFDNLVLSTHDRFVFQGDLDLSLAGSVNLKGGLLTVSDRTPDAQVRIAAPYIRLDGGSWDAPTLLDNDTFVPGVYSPRAGQASAGHSALTFSGNLIDVAGRVVSGASAWEGVGNIAGTSVPSTFVAQDGFADLSLVSAGDIRLAGGLNAQGNINLTAAQVYPVSSGYAAVIAGDRYTGIAPDSRLTIRANGAGTPDTPYSVFGQLILMGGAIDQGGVVRAPLGVISLNTVGGNLGTDWQQVLLLGQNGVLNAVQTDPTVILRNGSLTSVSAAGLEMPYGGTTDGVTYRGLNVGGRYATQYNLADTFVSRGDTSGVKSGDTRVLATGVNIGAAHLVGEAGAVIDLSGGGTLHGEGFVSGRGGSVNVLATPLANANPAANAYSSAGNRVYAILPGYKSQYAPVVLDNGAGDPAVGRQITIGDGVPGLPAGTYTLMPSSFALMPGAYRVELAGTVPLREGAALAAMPTGDGSWTAAGTQRTAGTGQYDNQLTRLIVTPGAAVRKLSQFNETTLSEFLLSQAKQFGTVRARLPEDGKLLNIAFQPATTAGPALDFAGTVRFGGVQTPEVTGVDGALFVTGGASLIEVRTPGAAPTAGMVSLVDRDLNAFAAPSLGLGGYWTYFDGQSSLGDSARLYFGNDGLLYNGVTVRSGAALRAGQVFLVGKAVNVESGASIDTRGFDGNVIDSRYGYVYATGLAAGKYLADHPGLLAVGNGWLEFLPSDGYGTVSVGDGASLLTQGTIAFAAPGALSLGDVNLGARYLTVSQDQINIGEPAAMASAPAGWKLTQDALDTLLRPSASSGVPALERLTLTAGGSFNFFGTTTLDTGDSPVQMVFNSPAFYGLGSSTDVVRLSTSHFLWNGVSTGSGTTDSPFGSQAPAAVLAGGPGTGTGKLVVDARTIEFGYDDLSQAQRQSALDRLTLGFSDVTLQASERVTANHLGTLTVGGTQAADGSRRGGDLHIVAPLVTGKAGSSMRYDAGGTISLTAPAGGSPAPTAAVQDLGASLAFRGRSVDVQTALALPSGKLSIDADGAIVIGPQASLDLAGRDTAFFDVTQPSWGGKIQLASANGNIALQRGAVIDVSSPHAAAGSLGLSAPQGQVSVDASVLGTAEPGQTGAQFALDVGSLSGEGFAALNQSLNDGGFFGSRAFRLRQGDLTVGDGVRASNVSIATDNGSLAVIGTIDASGATPGAIMLSALGDLALGRGAVLDTHATRLVTDSYGASIDASNRGHVALTSSTGTVRLGDGVRFDMRSPDGVARGRIDINAPRADETSGDIRIDASARPDIAGARSIAVNGFWKYSPTDANGTVTQDNGDAAGAPVGGDGVVGLAQIDARSRQFIDNATRNASLQSRLAGLASYGDAFHLRPGVEIASAADINTKGDLDLSGYRYGPGAAAGVRGAGEPGVLVLRAGGDLKVNGSITDGFGAPVASPDGAVYQTVLSAVTLTGPYTVAASGLTLGVGSKLPATGTLNFSLDLAANTPLYLSDTSRLPIDVVLGGNTNSNRIKANVVTTADIILPEGYRLKNGTTVGPGGYRIAAGTNTSSLVGIVGTTASNMLLPPGTILKAGMNAIQFSDSGPYIMRLAEMQWPANTSVAPIKNYALANPLDLPQGAILPGGMYVSTAQAQVGERPIWAIAPMLEPGVQSWSMRLVGGSDLASPDSRAVHGAAQGGDIVLNDPFTVNVQGKGLGTPAAGISVVRTGTGDLELYAGGDYQQLSPFGVYTAGSPVAGTGAGTAWNAPRALAPDGTYLGSGTPARAGYEATLNAQRMWYTQDGGDFTLSAGGNILGWQEPNSEMVGNWVLRQGGAALNQPTAWGVNFGTYALDGNIYTATLGLSAFSGMGALGGGNVNVRAGGNIGVDDATASRNVVVAVGGSGRVTDAGIVQTGGGSLNVSAGGNVFGGLYADIRGDTKVSADGNIGAMLLRDYGVALQSDPRGLDSHTPYSALSRNGADVAPGDGNVVLQALGDVVMGKVVDPGRAEERVQTQATLAGVSTNAASWFTLWRDDTAIRLFAAGGSASPLGNVTSNFGITTYLPPILDVTAAGGSIYFAPRQFYDYLMPSPDSRFQFLARDAISGVNRNNASVSAFPFGTLGTSLSSLATPAQPGWQTANASNYWGGGTDHDSNTYENIYNTDYNPGYGAYTGLGGGLAIFGPNTLTDTSADGNGALSRLYAVNGSVQSARIGEIRTFYTPSGYASHYLASKPVQIKAGGDIVNTNGLINQTRESDVSMMAAAGDILYGPYNNTGFTIAGPGTFEVSAGGDIYLGNVAGFTSLGPLVAGDKRPGANIVVQAGLGAGAPGQGQTDVAAFARRYFDPANLADPSQPLAAQPGKVAKTYEAELLDWLRTRFGYTGQGGAAALAWFLTLPAEQQRVMVREAYYAELLASGREYNDASGKRSGSYLRGREAIAALFPQTDANARPIARSGGLTLFQGATSNGGIRTVSGGDIELLVPAGQTTLGVEGVTPSADPATVPAGLLTQGEGAIRMYSLGSILLGLSRVMTTFGGDIQGWSAEGDINAGRGSKTTVLYTPPRRVYDAWGNVTLSPNVPSSGAGIATLNPIPEVRPGDVDLVAPLGTIDAGEAGIRVSGNVNFAALAVVNAANVQVQGKSVGLPLVAAVNVGALTNASATAAQAAAAAQDAMARERVAQRQNQPSIFTVRMLGTASGTGERGAGPGGGQDDGGGSGAGPQASAYDRRSRVQIVGHGAELSSRAMSLLTPAERAALQAER